MPENNANLQQTAGDWAGQRSDVEKRPTTAKRLEHDLPPASSIRHLLVPLDGSPYAERALPYAAALASATGAAITVAHVSTPLGPRTAFHLDSVVRNLAHRRSDKEDTDLPTYLGWLREWLMAYVPDVDIEQVEAPSVLEGLLEIEHRTSADVMVIASHARQGAGRVFLGSVADGLVREGNAPVLVIPPLAPMPEDAIPLLTQVLVPLDGSELAEQALGPVLGWMGGAVPSELAPRELTLVSAAEHEQLASQYEGYLSAMREMLTSRLRSVRVSAHTLLGSPSEAIVTAAESGLPSETGQIVPANLIIMSTHGRGGLGRWLYGSVAEYVLPRVHVPVLLTHPRQASSSTPPLEG